VGEQSGTQDGSQAPDIVRDHKQELFDEARLIVGERFAGSRIDPDRGLRVTVIDLGDRDIAAITRLAQRLGIEAWVRLEPADPAALAAWEGLRVELLRLREVSPRVLRGYPMPNPGHRRPPVEIHLAPDAEATAADLHARFGDFVSLQVGALGYPPESALPPTSLGTENAGLLPVDPAEIRLVLDGPLTIRTGDTTTHHVLVTNQSDRDIGIETNGHLTATIGEADTGAPVGGYAGAQRLPLVTFTAGPSKTVRIPLLVGTASYRPELGYTVPPGTWHLTARLRLADGRHLVSPPLELTITG
jgi:hypothetical protein